jgi:hypothetical protein
VQHIEKWRQTRINCLLDGYFLPMQLLTPKDGRRFMEKKHVSVVFVVDDEVVISKSLALILQRSGYTTRFFTDPAGSSGTHQGEPSPSPHKRCCHAATLRHRSRDSDSSSLPGLQNPSLLWTRIHD